jgi:hypothetical protein
MRSQTNVLPDRATCLKATAMRRPELPEDDIRERFDGEITGPFAPRTSRLHSIVHHLGLALGGRPGKSLARRLLLGPLARTNHAQTLDVSRQVDNAAGTMSLGRLTFHQIPMPIS